MGRAMRTMIGATRPVSCSFHGGNQDYEVQVGRPEEANAIDIDNVDV